jgi:putative ABC transport system substrate-binding protein
MSFSDFRRIRVDQWPLSGLCGDAGKRWCGAEASRPVVSHSTSALTQRAGRASLKPKRIALAGSLSVGGDPVQLGLVASLARPGGNLTGINIFDANVVAKRLRLLHDLVPKAVRVGILVNPANPSITETTLREVQKAARTIGLQTQILNATTIGEIYVAFTHERLDALFVAADGFFNSRRVQIAILAAHNSIPVAFSDSSYVEVGGLMSYGTNVADMFRRVGVYTGRVLNGTKPPDLAVTQFTKFEFVINLQTARALHIVVPPAVLTIADEVIE